jgi:hypothetical protein
MVRIPPSLSGADTVFAEYVQDKPMFHGVNDDWAKWLSKLGFVSRSNR